MSDARARDAGVKIGFGTDLIGESHRLQSDEFRIRAEVLPPGEIIASTATVAAEILGMDGKPGVIEPGAIADMLVVDGNPLRDLNCLLGQGEHLELIMKGASCTKAALGHDAARASTKHESPRIPKRKQANPWPAATMPDLRTPA